MYCGFLDLVGTKNLATESPDEYYEALLKFQLHVADIAHRLESGNLYFLSDSVFFESDTARGFLDFFRELRLRLFRERFYFKAAISASKSGLEAREAQNQLLVGHAAIVHSVRVHGHHFGRMAVTLYQLQERLKGIGTVLDDKAKRALRTETVWSCHLPIANSHSAHLFRDVRFTRDEATVGNLRGAIRTAFDAKIRSRKLGRYYISLFVSWIQSIDFREGDGAEIEEVVSAFVDGLFDRMFSDLAGIEYVYLTLFSKISENPGLVPERSHRQVVGFLRRRRRVLGRLEAFPKEILSVSARRRIVDILDAPRDLKFEPTGLL